MPIEDTQDGVANNGLSVKQERAIVALMVEQTIVKAAEASGVSERTLFRWTSHDEKFKRAYLEARRSAYSQGVGIAQKFASVAVNALLRIATNPKSPPSAVVAAATALLRVGREGIELDDVVVRVESLERDREAAKRSGERN